MRIGEVWEKAQPVKVSAEVQAMSDANGTGTAEARYSRATNEVLVAFPSGNDKTIMDMADAAGERAGAQIMKGLIGGDVVARIPAQTYVDKLGGDVPGLKRQVG